MRDEESRVLREFLATHDAVCAGCQYSLRGLEQPNCPECGLAIRIPATEEVGLSESERLVRWLRDHDLVCKKCRTNLRGGTSNVCPTCGKTYMLQHGAHLAGGAPPSLSWTGKRWSGARIVMMLLFLVVPGLLLLTFVVVQAAWVMVKMFAGKP